MATQSRINEALEISRIAMQISMQGKYHVFANYSGHVDAFNVFAYEAAGEYSGNDPKSPMAGWSCIDPGRNLYLDTCTDEQMSGLMADVRALLDVDADGVPV